MPRHTVLTAIGGRPDSFRLAMIGPIAYPSAGSSTWATDSASPWTASGPASKAPDEAHHHEEQPAPSAHRPAPSAAAPRPVPQPVTGRSAAAGAGQRRRWPPAGG